MQITPNRFEHLITLVGYQIEKRTTRIREPISASQKNRSHTPLSSYLRIPTITDPQLSYWKINRLSNCFGKIPEHTLRVLIFAIFANFGHFQEIKYPRNLYRDRIRENLHPRKKF